MNNHNLFPCQRLRPQTQSHPMSRREMLRRSSSGFGAVALAALSRDPAYGGNAVAMGDDSPIADLGFAGHGPHHKVRAKNVIFLYMDGGPSQVDTFDPKPLLDKYDGQDPGKLFDVEPTQFNNNGNVLASPWKFKQHGDAGIPISSLFPHVAKHADELSVIRSMVSEFSEHTFANYFLHTGSGLQGRPSMGAWVNYGLGSECNNLPGFVTLNGGLIPPGGLDCFGSGFLPASYQGSIFKPTGSGLANIERTEPTASIQRSKLDLVNQLDSLAIDQFGQHDSLESAIRNYELAYSMQMAVPEVMSVSDEPCTHSADVRHGVKVSADANLWGAVLDRSPNGGTGCAVCRTDLSQGGRRSLGSTREFETGSRKQRARRRSTDCGIANGPS